MRGAPHLIYLRTGVSPPKLRRITLVRHLRTKSIFAKAIVFVLWMVNLRVRCRRPRGGSPIARNFSSFRWTTRVLDYENLCSVCAYMAHMRLECSNIRGHCSHPIVPLFVNFFTILSAVLSFFTLLPRTARTTGVAPERTCTRIPPATYREVQW